MTSSINPRGRVVMAATLDTKFAEIEFVRARFAAEGIETLLIDCGVLGVAGTAADISRESVAEAGGMSLAALQAARSREKSIPVMIAGLKAHLAALLERGEIAGFYGIGGGTNAALASAAFEVLPFGMPKMLVTTVASGNTRPFVGMKDVTLVHSVVDVLGLNSYLRQMIRQSVAGFAGMLRAAAGGASTRPPAGAVVGLTAFGSTTGAAAAIEAQLAGEGVEVLTFHARGIGGLAMERFVEEGRITAVLDLTTTEVADEIVGGICGAGPDRLRAAGALGLPQVILPGAVDMVNFGPRATVPAKFDGRNIISHTPHSTLMRTTVEENRLIAAFIAERLNAATGPVRVILPMGGFSAYDAEGQPFHDPAADAAFCDTLESLLSPGISVRRIASHINAPECALAACAALAELGALSPET